MNKQIGIDLNCIRFEFKDIPLDDDLKSLKLSHAPIEFERLQAIYQQAFLFDLLYRFAQEHLNASNQKEPEGNLDQSNNLGLVFVLLNLSFNQN